MNGRTAERRMLWPALAAALGLTVLAGLFMYGVARAPDDHEGRILVFFQEPLTDREAYARLAASGAEPLRLMSAAEGWVAEAREPGAVGRLRRELGAGWVFRDVGAGRTLAGCLAFARGPAEPRRTVP